MLSAILISSIISMVIGIFAGGLLHEKLIVQKRMKVSNEIELENRYLKGKEDGKKEAMNRLSIKYEGYIEENSTFFTKYIESGYYSQIMIDGIPISEKSKMVLSIMKESKDANIENSIKMINKSVENAINGVVGIGIKALKGSEILRLVKK